MSLTKVSYSMINGEVINVLDYGVVGDGTTDDTAALILAINAAAAVGKVAFIPGGKNVRITSPLDTLTTNPIRLTGPVSAWKRKNESNTGFATITCDNCALVGSFNSSTSTLTFRALSIPGLHNLVIKAAGGALYGAIISEYFADWSGLHFEGFAHHGIWNIGSTLCNFGPISFYNVGEGRTTNGLPLDSDNFVDGCAVLAVGSCTSGVAGNVATTRTFSGANYGGSTNWDIAVENTQTTSTSFKGFIGFNQRNSILRFRGYNGIWIAYCDIDIPAPTIEVYANGGVIANDGLPYALVTLNSSPFITDQLAVTAPANPNGSVRFLRTTAFSTGTDYWGYAVNLANKTAFSRAQVTELVLGDYKPDAGSYSITPVAGLGTAANPMGYFDTTLRAMRFSAGTRFVPSGLSLPLYTSGTVATGSFVDVDASIFAPATVLFGTSKGVYEVDVQIVDGATGAVFYHGTWKAFRQPLNNNYELRFYALGSVNNNPPAGGFTVAENGSGPYTLRISNATAADYTYIVNGTLVNSCYTTTY
jgi:hypothetical protein